MKTTSIPAHLGTLSGKCYLSIARAYRFLALNINRQEVFSVFLQGLVALVVLTYFAGILCRQAWERILVFSENLGQQYSALVLGTCTSNDHLDSFSTNSPINVQVPFIHPISVMADQLSALTVRELKGITGCKGKVLKHQLIGLAVAV